MCTFIINETEIRYENGEIHMKNRYNHFIKEFEITIENFDDLPEDVKKLCITAALQGYNEGIYEGKRLKMNEIRKVIGASGI